MKSDAEAFRKRASDCRKLADGTKAGRAQDELRALANDLDDEAAKIDDEEARRRGEEEDTLP